MSPRLLPLAGPQGRPSVTQTKIHQLLGWSHVPLHSVKSRLPKFCAHSLGFEGLTTVCSSSGLFSGCHGVTTLFTRVRSAGCWPGGPSPLRLRTPFPLSFRGAEASGASLCTLPKNCVSLQRPLRNPSPVPRKHRRPRRIYLPSLFPGSNPVARLLGRRAHLAAETQNTFSETSKGVPPTPLPLLHRTGFTRRVRFDFLACKMCW